jgi:hypothetical protein
MSAEEIKAVLPFLVLGGLFLAGVIWNDRFFKRWREDSRIRGPLSDGAECFGWDETNEGT